MNYVSNGTQQTVTVYLLPKCYYDDPDLILLLEAMFGIWPVTNRLTHIVEDALNDT